MYYERLIRLVDKHPDSTSRFKLCAVALKGSRVMSIGYNRPKTDPNVFRVITTNRIDCMYKTSHTNYVSCNIHAESNALKRLKGDADTLFVIRRDLNGKLTMAKPCNVCMGFIAKTNIKTIFFSNEKGEIEEMRL